MPVPYPVFKQRLAALKAQVALRFDSDETRPEFKALLALVTAPFGSITGPPAAPVLTVARELREAVQKILDRDTASYYAKTPRDPIGTFVPVDFSGVCPVCPEAIVQHQWNLNGQLKVADKIDGDHAFGFSGTINFALFKRRLAGSGGQETLDIRKNGVTIFSGTPNILAANGNDFPIRVTALAITTFSTLDNFTFHLTEVETGTPEDVEAILDVTRTGA